MVSQPASSVSSATNNPDAAALHAHRALVDVEGMREGVDTRLHNILAEQETILTAISGESAPLIDAWRVLLSGGKRLRAAFAYWGYRAANPTPGIDPGQAESLFRIGAALELFQAAALFHDDVMDRSDSRRGNPTAHKAFEALHQSNNFVGDADQYGTSTAILLGDLSLVASESEFRAASYGFAEQQRQAAHDYFDTMRTTVSVGQFLDVHAQVAPWDGDYKKARERAFDIIRTKTSSYSVTYPILLGASLGCASQEQLAALEAFAMPIGIAYQLFDDLLGAFGDPATTGKPAGDDIREGKRTVLVLEALASLSGPEREFVQSALGRHDLADSEIERVLQLITESGAVESVQSAINELAGQGLAHLNSDLLNPVGTDMLRSLAHFALKREF